MRRYAPIGLILIAFLLVGALFALLTPDWQAPDEPAHYNYIGQLAEGNLPIIEPGDYDQEYQNMVISSGFDSQFSVDPFRYEDYQPPLYYLLLTPVFLVFGGGLEALRLASLLLGAGVVGLTYLVAIRIFPDRTWLALIAAAFVAFLPQHVAMLAAVNNDSLAELLIAGMLLLLVSILLAPREVNGAGKESEVKAWKWLLLGVLLGLGFITKVTVYIFVPVIALALVWLYRAHWRSLWRGALMVFGPAMTIGLVWWIRNVVAYGALDPLGTLAHNTIVVGQPRSEEWIDVFGFSYLLRNFIQTTFQSFWGQFGWMGVPMPRWVYLPLLLFTVAIFIGLGWLLLQKRKAAIDPNDDGADKKNPALVTAIFVALFLLSLLAYVGYNITFVQHQGRYLFSALIPISLGVAVGSAALLAPLSDRWPILLTLLPILIAAALIILDLIALFRFIIPTLT
jgi:4-amino-4-deoxy-L-arabinose transferase-like glycosyltransferase